MQAGVDHVDLGHGEVLAQDGQTGGVPGRLQVAHRPTEELHVGQHREAGRTTRHVLLGHQVGLEVGVEVALGRGPALHLGDTGETRHPERPGEVARHGQRAGPRRLLRLHGELVGVPVVVPSLRPVRCEDVRQVGGHSRPA